MGGFKEKIAGDLVHLGSNRDMSRSYNGISVLARSELRQHVISLTHPYKDMQ